MASWQEILNSPATARLHCRNERAWQHGAIAGVVCEEVINETVLIATNLFIREDGTWRMFHHHSGLIASGAPEVPEVPEPAARRLH